MVGVMQINRAALLAGSALALTWAAPSSAQTQPQEDVPVGTAAAGGQGETVLDPEPQGTDDIVVTGTRLTRDPNEVAPSPISTVTAADLRSTGQIDVSETLREVPALSNSISIGDSLERDVATNLGVASLDLRGLGVDRTLVVVNGRRHVSGVPGSQAVDISTIPPVLIDRVEVLTGGASAVYGADAVTGVVNFVLKRDFEGLDLNLTQGISDEGDGRQFTLDAAIGKNFDEGRGNITLAASYTTSDEIQYGDRPYTANNARANSGLTYPNPALRFQRGEITGATPNFQRLYQVTNFGPDPDDPTPYFPYGYRIPSAADFTSEYQRLFGTVPVLTSAEQALIARTSGAPSLAFQSFPSFAISSTQGLIARDDYQGFLLDVNRNGVQDCNESYIGATTIPNFFGGCYVSTPGGGVKLFEDGIIASGSNQFGGDGAPERFSAQSLLPKNMRVNLNLLTQYEYSDALTLFAEGKYVRSETRAQNPYNTFYDSLYIAPDNPFIPAQLQADANEAGGLRVSRDFTDLGPGITEAVRDTYRIVGGARGAVTPELNYEVSTNYGRTDSAVTFSNSVLYDRLFAAIDVVQGPNGPQCRSNTDPTPYRGSEFFPSIEGGFFTFTPGDGQCQPVSLFNGSNSVSQAGVDFITTPTTTRVRLEQFVANAQLVGNTGAFFNLPGGAVQFAIGGEYREEKSRTRFDPLDLGLLPANSPAGPAGTFIGDISANQALTFDAQTRIFNSGGAFDVKEIYGELRLPIAKDRPFFEQLELSGAARYSDYSTVGGTFTWNVNGVYAPISDIRLRGTYAVAIRAPNIAELFDPQQGTVFRPADPCDAAQIATAVDPARRQANCSADGLPVGFEDPLSARFSGTTGGNPDLREETAKTYTFGGVLAPRFIPGLVVTADYYNIEIEDAINAVSAQDIVDSCYDAQSLENQFCDLFTRNRNPASPTFLGLNFLRQTQLNFGRIETSGIDAAVSFQFRLGENRFQLRANGNWTEKLDFFFNPSDPTANDPELGERGRPEFSATGSVNWQRGPFSLGYRLQYLDRQAIEGVEIETADRVAGPAGFANEVFVHDVSFNFELEDRFSVYGGVNNLTDVDPYRTNTSYPVSPLGRYLFLGVRIKTGPLF